MTSEWHPVAKHTPFSTRTEELSQVSLPVSLLPVTENFQRYYAKQSYSLRPTKQPQAARLSLGDELRRRRPRKFGPGTSSWVE